MIDRRFRATSRTLVGVALALASSSPLVSSQSPRLVLDAKSGPLGSMNRSQYLTTVSRRAGEVLLVLEDQAHGAELWRTDGTAAGTTLVVDLTPGPAGTRITSLEAQADGLWFLVSGASGSALWHSDGTATGTTQVLALPGASLGTPSFWFPDGSFLLGVNTTLHRSDGTIPGTVSLGIPFGTVIDAGNGRFWVDTWYTQEVWQGDGTPAGSSRLATSVIAAHPAFGGLLVAQTGGANQVTVQVLGVPALPQFTVNEDAWVLVNQDAVILYGTSTLWRWDGVSAPRVLRNFASLRDPRVGMGPVWARDGNALMFVANDGASGFEPWWSDLRPAGTRRLLDLTPGSASTHVSAGVAVRDRVVFWANLAATGNEPWTTDGTPAGTTLLADLEPGTGDSTPGFSGGRGVVLAGQRRVVTPIFTSAFGNELWITDGSSAGTSLLADLNPGPASSVSTGPWRAWSAGTSLIFAADDGTHGLEPFAIDLEGARSWLIGGCSRATRYSVGDPVLGAPWTLSASGVALAGMALISFVAPNPTDVGGRCLVQLDLATSVPLAVITPNAQGAWRGTIAMPNTPSLRGARLVTQAVFLPSSHPLGVELGDAWFLTLGF